MQRVNYETLYSAAGQQSQQAYKQYMCSTSGHRRHRADTRAHTMPQGNTATRYRAVTVHRLVKQGQSRLRVLAGLQGSKAQWVPLFNQGTESTMRALVYSTTMQHSQWVRVWSATIKQTTQMHSISGHAGTEQTIRVMQRCEAAKTTGVRIVHIHTDPAHIRHREDYEIVCTVLKKQHSQQAYELYASRPHKAHGR